LESATTKHGATVLNSQESIVQYDLLSNKRFRIDNSKNLTKSWDLNGSFLGTERQEAYYDDYGNVVTGKQLKSINDLSMTSAEALFEHRNTNTATYVEPDLPNRVISLPDITTSTQVYGSKPAFVQNVDYDYYESSSDNYPLIKDILSYFNNSPGHLLATKKSFEYNNPLKLISKETLSAPNDATLVSRSNETTYDPEIPYLTNSKINALNHTESYVYDANLLNIKQKTDLNGLVTHFNTDELGTFNMTEFADGNIEYNTARWSAGYSSNPTNGLYYSWNKTSNHDEILIFYNKLGQEIRRVSKDFNGNTIYIDSDYDSYGRLHFQTIPYFAASPPNPMTGTTKEYDLLSRVTTITNPDNTIVTYGYNGLTTTVTDDLAHSSETTVNAAGWSMRSEDPDGKAVIFDYYSNGQVQNTYIEGLQTLTSISNEYNAQGNTTKITDPDAGIIEFAFNAFGESISRKDARQTVPSTFTYDKLGRMLTRTEPEGTTTWEYDTKAYGKGLLSKTILGSHETEYTYDELSRVIADKEKILTNEYVNTYKYDWRGRMVERTYPSGYKLTYEFYPNSDLHIINQLVDNVETLVWESTTTDNFGSLINFNYGNNTAFSKTYNNVSHRLEDVNAMLGSASVYHMQYDWDEIGNLNYRRDVNRNLTESFMYDDLSRLTTVSLNGNQIMSMAYDANGLGNISSKTAYGSNVLQNAVYGENGTGPHALTHATFNNAAFPSADQLITEYTSYNKIKQLSETGSGELNVEYGHHHQRIKQVVYDGTGMTMKYYVGGDYEVINDYHDNGEKKIHYLSGPEGIFAMYTINPDNTSNLWYLFRDHLGSVNKIVDATDNSTVQELSFDAWGNRRNPLTWQPFTGSIPQAVTDRGFTFHEHLYGFGLINMNGRMYDPRVGRFMSCDPFVQAPGNTQSLNRYSYCVNNPLKYIDPSGENPIIIACMVLGSYLGGVATNQGELNPMKWNYGSVDTWFGIGIGALTGYLGGYGIVHPGTVSFYTGIATPAAAIYIGGNSIDWNIRWTTEAGGDGEINPMKSIELDEIISGSNKYIPMPPTYKFESSNYSIYGNQHSNNGDLNFGRIQFPTGIWLPTVIVNWNGTYGSGEMDGGTPFWWGYTDNMKNPLMQTRTMGEGSEVLYYTLAVPFSGILAGEALGYLSYEGYQAVLWRYPGAGGRGLNFLKDGKRIIGFDWHRFRLKGKMVNRFHIDNPSWGWKHWPW
jgi:RHS repeat-associated protein